MRRLSLVAVALGSVACAGTRELVAENGSHRLIAADSGTGVSVVLTTEVWSGDPAWTEDLTIVHVLIANNGDEPVLLAPGDFELHDRLGFAYPLYDAGGSFAAVPEGVDPEVWTPPNSYDPGGDLDFETLDVWEGELAEMALPWGVLLPGTQMRGFLYFADVRASAYHTTLIWHAQTPDHRPLADFGFALGVAVLDRQRVGNR